RGNIDDTTITALEHTADHRAATQKGTDDVDGQYRFQIGLLQFPKIGGSARDAGVIDEDIDGREPSFNGTRRLGDVRFGGNIAGAIFAPYVPRHPRSRRPLEIEYLYPGPDP